MLFPVFFSNPRQLFTYDALNVQKVLTIAVAVSVIVILVGKLKKRSDQQRWALEWGN